MPWQVGTRVMVPSDSPIEFNVIFLNTYTGIYNVCGVTQPSLPPPNVWIAVDLKPLGVPADALAVDLRGFLIISDGQQSAIPDLAVAFKSPNSNAIVGNYDEQTIAIGPTGGARTNGTAIAPCVNGCIDWAWMRGDSAQFPGGAIPPWPQNASYGLNISLQQVFLP